MRYYGQHETTGMEFELVDIHLFWKSQYFCWKTRIGHYLTEMVAFGELATSWWQAAMNFGPHSSTYSLIEKGDTNEGFVLAKAF